MKKLPTKDFDFERGKIGTNKILVVKWIAIRKEHLTTKEGRGVITIWAVFLDKFVLKVSVDYLLIN